MLIALHKPYGVLSQFTPELPGQRCLNEFGLPREVYPVGRLDQDSEGLLLLTNERPLIERLLHPRNQHPRTYHVLVERQPTGEALHRLRSGVPLDGQLTLPCRVRELDADPGYAPRIPPVRTRKTVLDVWLELTLTEGKNRQVRRMTAAVGHPTLRLIRAATGQYQLGALLPGDWKELSVEERTLVLNSAS